MRNFLRTVVFQVKFPTIENFAARQSEIQDAVKSTFFVAATDEQTFQITLDSGTPVITPAEGVPGTMEFHDTSRQKIFNVSNDTLSLTISGAAYTNFRQVQNDLNASIYAVTELLQIKTFSRVAIRKINLVSARSKVVSPKAKEMIKGVFNNDLLTSVFNMPAAEHLLTSITNSRFVEGDNTLNIVYGLLPKQDFEPDSSHLLLDIDLFNSSTHSSIEEIKSNFNLINDAIYNIFIWSLQPSLISILSA
ncbi:TIGR04255 family protein [Hymenobacter ruricola]|uniref:TIGR04255 family protein n=1 Tax=Hymenobacter ruricola TaxID=2791023 RepID=A0ABS0I4Q0_9BACT|nr:TIGR04255 family protein [Hymenobacter ruricola]MBF9221766.1 TIGR04255 family protein [Hymenobacter ruricola]